MSTKGLKLIVDTRGSSGTVFMSWEDEDVRADTRCKWNPKDKNNPSYSIVGTAKKAGKELTYACKEVNKNPSKFSLAVRRMTTGGDIFNSTSSPSSFFSVDIGKTNMQQFVGYAISGRGYTDPGSHVLTSGATTYTLLKNTGKTVQIGVGQHS